MDILFFILSVRLFSKTAISRNIPFSNNAIAIEKKENPIKSS